MCMHGQYVHGQYVHGQYVHGQYVHGQYVHGQYHSMCLHDMCMGNQPKSCFMSPNESPPCSLTGPRAGLEPHQIAAPQPAGWLHLALHTSGMNVVTSAFMLKRTYLPRTRKAELAQEMQNRTVRMPCLCHAWPSLARSIDRSAVNPFFFPAPLPSLTPPVCLILSSRSDTLSLVYLSACLSASPIIPLTPTDRLPAPPPPPPGAMNCRHIISSKTTQSRWIS